MARYSFLLHANSDGELVAFHATFTSEGPVVIIFSQEDRLQDFLDLLSPILAIEGKKLAYASQDADSIESIVASILQMDPSMSDATFVPDDAPIVDTILDYYEGVSGNDS